MSDTGLAVLIPAAGASSRMRGRDKLLDVIDGTPLLRRQVEMGRIATQGEVLVALPPPPHPRYEVLAGLNVSLVPVPDAQEGIGASLRRAITALPVDTEWAIVLLADLPDLVADDLRTIQRAIDRASDPLVYRGATEDGLPGHPIAFHKSLFPALRQLSGDTGGREIVSAAKGNVVLVPLPGQRARCDLDTPEDWAAWRAARALEN